jgi:hypothetical protein
MLLIHTLLNHFQNVVLGRVGKKSICIKDFYFEQTNFASQIALFALCFCRKLIDRREVPDLSVSGINLDLVVVRPSRSDYDERTRCANAIAKPYLQWLPTSRCEISLITKIVFPARNR